MRVLVAAFALLVAVPAAADVYSLTISMPMLSGAAQCKPYVNGTALEARPCGSAQTYAGAAPSEGSYVIDYAGVSALGLEGDRGPAVTVVIDKKPETPSGPPTVTVSCRDSSGDSVPCPATITVTQTP